MRWIVGLLVVFVAACGSDVGTVSSSADASTTDATSSTGGACPSDAACREGSVGDCGEAVAPICSADSWSCPDGSIEAAACDGPLPCDDSPPGCWNEGSTNCEDSDRRDAVCREDGIWECPPGAQDWCGHGDTDECVRGCESSTDTTSSSSTDATSSSSTDSGSSTSDGSSSSST